ncbi:hypothetical protein EJ08DRAFT_282694 [Tothia fuscella]|uniref:Cenp-O kinetochore centromere component n=1 Tax=Tothia fuscella TaxID=1048955 RepID=A0A9P4U379_9PEZI|nr:hypothetical protein EJ08DRAFT_282694 [Tothia fuscella]
MELVQVPDSQLDGDIAVIRTQIESLRHRRSLLANTLLSNRKIQQRLKLKHAKATATSSSLPTITLALQQTEDQTEDQASINASNLYRTCSGITAFRVKDPDPNSLDSGHVLGVRIDVFSTTDRRFITPYYLLLNYRPETGSSALQIHKHTIPTFVPLPKLAVKYLPHRDSTGSTSQERVQNLPALVRALRRELVSYHKRLAAWEVLRTDLKTNKALDPAGTEFEIELSDTSIARLKVDAKGNIENAVVRSRSDAKYDELPDNAGKRQRGLERAILGAGGRIEGLADRLKDHTAS